MRRDTWHRRLSFRHFHFARHTESYGWHCTIMQSLPSCTAVGRPTNRPLVRSPKAQASPWGVSGTPPATTSTSLVRHMHLPSSLQLPCMGCPRYLVLGLRPAAEPVLVVASGSVKFRFRKTDGLFRSVTRLVPLGRPARALRTPCGLCLWTDTFGIYDVRHCH